MKLARNNVVIIGASGAIGTAMVKHFSEKRHCGEIHAFSEGNIPNKLSNVNYHKINYSEDISIRNAAESASHSQPIDLVFVANGILHKSDVQPEKTYRDLSFENFKNIFEANIFVPAIIAKYFLPKMNSEANSVFATLSARVGSISDNRLGGWYAYRSSKAALNMIIKNLSIETGRRSKKIIVVGLHPGTVDSPLSKPFQKGVPKEKLFSPEYSCEYLVKIMDRLNPDQSGKVFSWDGTEIQP